jgi:uncharacterized protein YndB with AHSA1/START domain
MKMPRIESSVVISRPVEEVFEFVTNPENDPQWQSAILESKRTSAGPLGVGTTEAGVGKIIGRRIEWTGEVTEYEPNKKVKYLVTGGPLTAEQTVTFEPVEGGTKFTLGLDPIGEDASGFFRLAEPIVIRMLQRDIETDAANLKDLLEAEA